MNPGTTTVAVFVVALGIAQTVASANPVDVISANASVNWTRQINQEPQQNLSALLSGPVSYSYTLPPVTPNWVNATASGLAQRTSIFTEYFSTLNASVGVPASPAGGFASLEISVSLDVVFRVNERLYPEVPGGGILLSSVSGTVIQFPEFGFSLEHNSSIQLLSSPSTFNSDFNLSHPFLDPGDYSVRILSAIRMSGQSNASNSSSVGFQIYSGVVFSYAVPSPSSLAMLWLPAMYMTRRRR